MRKLLCLAIVLAAGSVAMASPIAKPSYPQRWFYAMFNLQVEANADRLIELMNRASKAGYNGVVLADYKLNILDRVPDHYFRNVARVRDAAKRAGIAIIPAVFPIGYSNGLLAHDPNLAEGLPATSRFVVRGRQATLAPRDTARFANGDLETTRDNRFPGFRLQDDPGQATVPDREDVHGGKVSCRMRDTDKTSTSAGNARLMQTVKVRPRACYRFSAWVKTQELTRPGGFRLLALGAEGGRPLTFFEGGLDPNQDWKRVEVVFNTLDQSAVNLYAGLWGGSPGTLWIDDLKLEELALVNLLRRRGCPLVVTSEDGRTAFAEGRDFRRIEDSKLGRLPYAGEFEFDHEGPSLILTPDSRIQDGQALLVSWYHPILVHGSQIACCLSEPEVYERLRDQARRVNELFRPKTFFMSHDELRVANWCVACQSRGLTPGQLLADNVRRCTAILKEIQPEAEAVVWSDMFDPNHNAVENYFLVNGTLQGSWEGLPRSVIIANWNGGHPDASLRFFAKQGHRQIIAGFYDGDDLGNFRSWDQAAEGVDGVIGFLYTTWVAKFGLLEEYGRAMTRSQR